MEKDRRIPSVSIIIPVHNGRDHLARVLEPLLSGMLPGDELVIVDDRSTDGSAELAASLGVRVVSNSGNPGAAGARNTGSSVSGADWLLFIDSDAVAPEGWRELLDRRIGQGVEAVQAIYSRDSVGSNAATFFKNYYYHYTFTKRIRKPDIAGCGTFFFAVLRSSFQNLGGFDERISGATIEDADFAERLTGSGGRIRLAPEIEVFHLREYTFFGLLRYDWNMMRAKALYMLRRDRRHGSPSVSMASPGEMLPVITGAVGVWGIPAGIVLYAAGVPAGILVSVAGVVVVAIGQFSFWRASLKQGRGRGALAGLIVFPDLIMVIPSVLAALIRAAGGRKY